MVLPLLSSAHRPHMLDVTHVLEGGGGSCGNHTLSVTIASAVAASQAAAGAYPYAVPHLAQRGSIGTFNFLRKAASDFGWDWGPAFAPAGLGGATLRVLSSATLHQLSAQQVHLHNGSVLLAVDAWLLPGPGMEAGSLQVELQSPDGSQRWTQQTRTQLPAAADPAQGGGDYQQGRACPVDLTQEPASAAVLVRTSVALLLDMPLQLWWPYELGSQPLYNLTVTYTPDVAGLPADGGRQSAATSDAGAGPSSLSRRIGLRSVELVTAATAEGGESFYFRVNGGRQRAHGQGGNCTARLQPAINVLMFGLAICPCTQAECNLLARHLRSCPWQACPSLPAAPMLCRQTCCRAPPHPPACAAWYPTRQRHP